MNVTNSTTLLTIPSVDRIHTDNIDPVTGSSVGGLIERIR